MVSNSDVEGRVAALTGVTQFPRTPFNLNTLCGANMKGFSVLHIIDLMAEQGGQAMVDAWRATLPEALRQRVERRALTSVGWTPVELYYSAVAHLTNHRTPGSPRGAIWVGHTATLRDIGAFFRAVMKIASPSTVLKLSGRFWRSYFDTSSLTVTGQTPTSCTAEIRDWPLTDETSAHETAGALVAWMESGRCNDFRLTKFELISARTFAFRAEWK